MTTLHPQLSANDPNQGVDGDARPGAAVAASFAPSPALELSIVIPTYCEATNIGPMIAALEKALAKVKWEAVFVDDDSPDKTADIVRQRALSDSRIRAMRRIGRRGLAGAVIEGMLSSSADAIAVMDCDLQHDESILPEMLKKIEAGADLVVATRYSDDGQASAGFSKVRQRISEIATQLTNAVLHTSVSDPMSGFFMIRRGVAEKIAPNLSTEGFKLLLDILATAPSDTKIEEVPYTFRPRRSGASKLDSLVVADFLGLVFAKLTGNSVTPRFFLFALVGASGLAVHLATLRMLIFSNSFDFNSAQLAASFAAMTWNFFLNNTLTFRDRRLAGFGLMWGLLSFYAVCSFGTLANIGVAELVYLRDASWWRAGVAGALMAAVFNYAATSVLTWRK